MSFGGGTVDLGVVAEFVKQFEGCKLTSYQDQGGIWTIGYGHTGHDIVEGLTWTQDQAEAVLVSDLRWNYNAVCKCVSRALSQDQWTAIVSFSFNAGQGNFAGSSLHKAIEANEPLTAAKLFVAWDHVNGVENKGLLIRRLTEAALFLRGA